MKKLHNILAVGFALSGVTVFGKTAVSQPVSIDLSGSALLASPASVGYSPVWNGAVDGDGSRVEIVAVFRAGQESESTNTLLTADENASGVFSLQMPSDDTRAFRLIHRTVRDGTVVAESVKDVSYCVGSAISEPTFADTTDGKLDRIAATKRDAAMLAVSGIWVDGAASVAIEHEETRADGNRKVVTLYQGEVPSSETFRFVPCGHKHSSCLCRLRFYGADGAEIGDPLVAEYTGCIAGLCLVIR